MNNKSSEVKQLVTSKKLEEIENNLPDRNITINELIDLLLDEGVNLLVIILIAPFLFPVSFPGSSTPFGTLIILLEISYLLNKSLYLPKRIATYEVSKETILKLFKTLRKILYYIEKISKPRGRLSTNKYISKVNAGITIILAMLLFLPLPVPLTDFIPAVSILTLAVSNLEKDSYLTMLGVIFSIGTVFYFISVGYIGIETIKMVLSYFNIQLSFL